MVSSCCGTSSKFDDETLIFLNSKTVEKNILLLQKSIQANKNNKSKLKEIMNSIKKIIKASRPPKNKYFALLVLNEIMKLKKPFIGKHFGGRLARRLSILACYDSREKNLRKNGETCLNSSQTDKKFSSNFYILLLESWSRWIKLYPNNTKLQKYAKIIPVMLVSSEHYDHFDRKSKEIDINSPRISVNSLLVSNPFLKESTNSKQISPQETLKSLHTAQNTPIKKKSGEDYFKLKNQLENEENFLKGIKDRLRGADSETGQQFLKQNQAEIQMRLAKCLELSDKLMEHQPPKGMRKSETSRTMVAMNIFDMENTEFLKFFEGRMNFEDLRLKIEELEIRRSNSQKPLEVAETSIAKGLKAEETAEIVETQNWFEGIKKKLIGGQQDEEKMAKKIEKTEMKNKDLFCDAEETVTEIITIGDPFELKHEEVNTERVVQTLPPKPDIIEKQKRTKINLPDLSNLEKLNKTEKSPENEKQSMNPNSNTSSPKEEHFFATETPKFEKRKKSKVNLEGIKVIQIQTDEEIASLSYATNDQINSSSFDKEIKGNSAKIPNKSKVENQKAEKEQKEEEIRKEIRKHFLNPSENQFNGISFRIAGNKQNDYLNSVIQKFEEDKKQNIPEESDLITSRVGSSKRDFEYGIYNDSLNRGSSQKRSFRNQKKNQGQVTSYFNKQTKIIPTPKKTDSSKDNQKHIKISKNPQFKKPALMNSKSKPKSGKQIKTSNRSVEIASINPNENSIHLQRLNEKKKRKSLLAMNNFLKENTQQLKHTIDNLMASLQDHKTPTLNARSPRVSHLSSKSQNNRLLYHNKNERVSNNSSKYSENYKNFIGLHSKKRLSQRKNRLRRSDRNIEKSTKSRRFSNNFEYGNVSFAPDISKQRNLLNLQKNLSKSLSKYKSFLKSEIKRKTKINSERKFNISKFSHNIHEVKSNFQKSLKHIKKPNSQFKQNLNRKKSPISHKRDSISKIENKYLNKSSGSANIGIEQLNLDSLKKINQKINNFDFESLENQKKDRKSGQRLDKSIEKIFKKYKNTNNNRKKFGFFRKKIIRETRKKSFKKTDELRNLMSSLKQSNSQMTLKNTPTQTLDESSHRREIHLEDVDGQGSNAQINLRYKFRKKESESNLNSNLPHSQFDKKLQPLGIQYWLSKEPNKDRESMGIRMKYKFRMKKDCEISNVVQNISIPFDQLRENIKNNSEFNISQVNQILFKNSPFEIKKTESMVHSEPDKEQTTSNIKQSQKIKSKQGLLEVPNNNNHNRRKSKRDKTRFSGLPEAKKSTKMLLDFQDFDNLREPRKHLRLDSKRSVVSMVVSSYIDNGSAIDQHPYHNQDIGQLPQTNLDQIENDSLNIKSRRVSENLLRNLGIESGNNSIDTHDEDPLNFGNSIVTQDADSPNFRQNQFQKKTQSKNKNFFSPQILVKSRFHNDKQPQLESGHASESENIFHSRIDLQSPEISINQSTDHQPSSHNPFRPDNKSLVGPFGTLKDSDLGSQDSEQKSCKHNQLPLVVSNKTPSFKACSAFVKNKLFENQDLIVMFENQSFKDGYPSNIFNFQIVYMSKKKGLKISSQISKHESIIIKSENISEFSLDKSCIQKFIVNLDIEKPNFLPKLWLSVNIGWVSEMQGNQSLKLDSKLNKRKSGWRKNSDKREKYTLKIPLPLSINKIVRFVPGKLVTLNSHAKMKKIDSSVLNLDQDLFSDAWEICEIFDHPEIIGPGIFKFFCIYPDLSNSCFIFKTLTPSSVEIQFFSSEVNPLHQEVFKWLCWLLVSPQV